MVFRSARAEDCWSSTCSRRRRLQAQHPEHGDRRLRARHGAKHTLVVTIDGVKVFQNTIGGEDDIKAIDQQQAPAVAAINARFIDIPVKVTAGPHKVGVMFVARTFAEPDEVLHSFRRQPARIAFRESAVWRSRDRSTRPAISDTPSRSRVFVCRPRNQNDELACAKTILSSIAQGVSPPDHRCRSRSAAPFYSAARALSDFDTAIRDALPTILASPKFLYRAERSPAGLAPGSIHAIGDVELASRLVLPDGRPMTSC